jgi:hypothetical protein
MARDQFGLWYASRDQEIQRQQRRYGEEGDDDCEFRLVGCRIHGKEHANTWRVMRAPQLLHADATVWFVSSRQNLEIPDIERTEPSSVQKCSRYELGSPVPCDCDPRRSDMLSCQNSRGLALQDAINLGSGLRRGARRLIEVELQDAGDHQHGLWPAPIFK